MQQFLADYGLWALFALSFLASTLIPLSSELVLALVLQQGTAPAAAVTVATVGNTLGACTSYWIGRGGGALLARRFLRTGRKELDRAERTYARWGWWSLFLSWLPIVGDPLCVFAGIFRHRFIWFLPPVAAGKLARYAVLAWAIAG